MSWPSALARIAEFSCGAIIIFSIANCAGRCCEAEAGKNRPVIIRPEAAK